MIQMLRTHNILIGLAFLTAALAWPMFRWKGSARVVGIIALCLVLFALPWLCPWTPVVPRAVVALTCVGLLLPKLIDACLVADQWRSSPLWQWLIFLPHSFRLIHRPDWRFPDPGIRHGAWLLLRGSIEILAGALLLRWALERDLGATSFWLDHAIKLSAAYLLGFDGGFVFLCGLARVLGIKVIDFSRHPILATTPADFWRRYNREAGRLLYEDLFKPLGGLRRPRRTIMLTFLMNGLFHEYLAWVVVGAAMGYQIAFFALHGLATAATFHLRPRGAAAVVGTLLTILFLFTTSILFFASIGWYPHLKTLP